MTECSVHNQQFTQTARQAGRQTRRPAGIWQDGKQASVYRMAGWQAYRMESRQTYRMAGRQAGRQDGIQAGIEDDRQADIQDGRPADRH